MKRTQRDPSSRKQGAAFGEAVGPVHMVSPRPALGDFSCGVPAAAPPYCAPQEEVKAEEGGVSWDWLLQGPNEPLRQNDSSSTYI